MDKDNMMHDLHIEIPTKMREELIEILPAKGMISILVRRFLASYIDKINEIKKLGVILPNPIDSTVEKLIYEDAELGVLNSTSNKGTTPLEGGVKNESQ